MLRFFLGWLFFTAGPGLALGRRLTRDLDPLDRWIFSLALGTAALPVLIELLGAAGLIRALPIFILVLLLVGLVRRPGPAVSRATRGDLFACAAIIVLAYVLGAVAFAHRLVETAGGLQLYGDYDSYDLSHYASWASDATHTIPPKAAFYAGHNLNAAYYPQLVLTMVHRFLGVDLLRMYFGYAWPTFLALGGLAFFSLVRLLASTRAALLAAILLMVGGDFSYVAAWLLPHQTFQWDYVLWSTNFLSPTMEVLFFNTWCPSLAVFFGTLYAIVQSLRTRRLDWLVASAFMLAVLFQFKPFAYIVLVGAMMAACVLSFGDWPGRVRLFLTLAVTGLFTLPIAYNVLTLPKEDQRSRLLIRPFVLPERMLIKLDLTDTIARFAPSRPLFLLIATAMFLAVGLGIRWLSFPGIVRALRGMDNDRTAWRVLGWAVVVGIALPFVLATEPYVDTLQFYQTGLYVAWIFAAVALAAFAGRHRAAGIAIVAGTILLALPSSAHYLIRKWNDRSHAAVADLPASERAIALRLREEDPEKTVILHDDPTAPSLLSIESDRRVVLGWGRGYYAVGSEERVRDVDSFFRSAAGNAATAVETLRKYHVTHVVVRLDRDRVSPDVLARLTPMLTFPDAALYAVPPAF